MTRCFYDNHGGYLGREDDNGSFYDNHGGYRGRGDDSGSFFGSNGGLEGRSDDGDGAAFGLFSDFFS